MASSTLIVDYSWSGTTAQMAVDLQQVTGADKVNLTVAQGTFPPDMFATADVASQQLSSGNLPTLTNGLPDFSHYQTLLVGGPVWSGKVATPVRSFLQQLGAFRGVVAPFYTDAGNPGGYEDDFEQLITQGTFVMGLGMTAGDLPRDQQVLRGWWRNFQN
ncbi:flavodoxin family protein [Levilactobacillus parabrevis]|uniref:flavodoxin family protein n=1 Tax=Levilactobacillus parabrevis TaxID=357278 RepID=UPI0021A58B3E|nr:flavodoxin [Levilactobacillus parabrevis]MCT4487560.1 flavodoxin [Levilactobacillus parabrevis]MCT4489167.1 flavodoxin [Levilactobacillus parabrevis]